MRQGASQAKLSEFGSRRVTRKTNVVRKECEKKRERELMGSKPGLGTNGIIADIGELRKRKEPCLGWHRPAWRAETERLSGKKDEVLMPSRRWKRLNVIRKKSPSRCNGVCTLLLSFICISSFYTSIHVRSTLYQVRQNRRKEALWPLRHQIYQRERKA